MASRSVLSSNVPALDELLGGGIEEGTSTLIAGAAGTGKSTIAAAVRACGRGPWPEILTVPVRRESADAVVPMRSNPNRLISSVNSGAVVLRQVDPAELAPGEFIHAIREAVLGGAKYHS